MSAVALAAALAFGAVGGVLAGLVGVGGGVVLVPFLYLMLDHPLWSGVAVPAGRVTVVAHATSLLVIVPTAVSALRSFRRAGLVHWRAVGWMGGGAAAAAAVTTRVAPEVPGAWLRAGFAVFLVVVGLRLYLRPATPKAGAVASDRPVLGIAGGLLVGAFSALLGVGGGLVAIPILLFAFRMDVKRVAAASMGVVVFAALAGSVGYLAARPQDAFPPGTVGYVHLPLALALMPGAVAGAAVGARWNQAMETDRLRRVFAVVLVVLGLRLALPELTAGLGAAVPFAHSPAPETLP